MSLAAPTAKPTACGFEIMCASVSIFQEHYSDFSKGRMKKFASGRKKDYEWPSLSNITCESETALNLNIETGSAQSLIYSMKSIPVVVDRYG